MTRCPGNFPTLLTWTRLKLCPPSISYAAFGRHTAQTVHAVYVARALHVRLVVHAVHTVYVA